MHQNAHFRPLWLIDYTKSLEVRLTSTLLSPHIPVNFSGERRPVGDGAVQRCAHAAAGGAEAGREGQERLEEDLGAGEGEGLQEPPPKIQQVPKKPLPITVDFQSVGSFFFLHDSSLGGTWVLRQSKA